MVSGTVNAALVLSSKARPQRVEFKTARNASHAIGLLTQSVQTAIQEASYFPTCGGKTVQLVFVSELVGVSEGTPKRAVSFGSPNRFWITSEAPHWQP